MALKNESWTDFFRLFTYGFEKDPLARKTDKRALSGAGVTQPGAMPDLRSGEGFTAGAGAYIRVKNDLIDLTSTSNRLNRYKEYERLATTMPEIDMAMTVFSDEACVAGSTLIETVFHGPKTIEWLVENKNNQRFPVYCYNFEKYDYTIGWAYDPRVVKEDETVRIIFDNGTYEIVTPDHRILRRNGGWAHAGDLAEGDELMPFYRIPPRRFYEQPRVNQFPRVFTFNKGWMHERQFIDEWKTGAPLKEYEKTNKIARLICDGLSARQIQKIMNVKDWKTPKGWYEKGGFSYKELKFLSKQQDRRRVISVEKWEKQKVYDLSVEKYENFCTTNTVMHNCQRDDKGRVFTIKCGNKEVTKELEHLFFHRGMLNLSQREMWNRCRSLFIKGDEFWEIVINPDDPSAGIQKLEQLPADSMYRIETTKGKVIEFQQSNEGPDFNAIQKAPVATATEEELTQSTAIRFAPEQIVHIRIGDHRRDFYPFGVSLIEPARGAAHQLRMMEDAMVVYRLCVVGDTRIRTKNGWKYIKDVKVNDDVFSLQNESKVRGAKITWFVDNGIQDVYQIKSDHVEITGTKTHPILVNREGIIMMVDIQDINLDQDKIVNITHDIENDVFLPEIKEQQWVRLDKKFINKNQETFKKSLSLLTDEDDRLIAENFLIDNLATTPRKDAEKICELYKIPKRFIKKYPGGINPACGFFDLPEKVDEDFARLFGFLIGDGSIRNKGINRWCELNFTTGVDEAINEKYKSLLSKYFGEVKFQQEKRHDGYGSKYVVNKKWAAYLFIKMGFIPNAKNKRIPHWVFNAKKSIRKAFIEGLADADGHIRKLKTGLWTCEFSLCNKQLIEDIKELWHGLGLASGHIRKRQRKGGHKIYGRKMPDTVCWELYISEKQIPKYEKLRSRTYCGEQRVYDFEVNQNEHNFIANGTCISNTRAPERRVFYIDIGQLPGHKAEAFVERLKDQFRKKKIVKNNNTQTGPSAVEERWHAPAQDEDYWLPTRPQSNTRIETLPGAQNLGEIDDTVYFRNKLFQALHFPLTYFSNEDPNATRITLSAQDVKFARYIERLQSYVEDALWTVSDRHLKLIGVPEEEYEDLEIKMTAPSDWRELSRAEVTTNRINNANAMKGSQLYADYDIMLDIMQLSHEDAVEKITRVKIQKLEDLKLQVLAQNPILLGIGLPGAGDQEIGAEPGGPNPMLGGGEMPGGMPPEMGGQGEPPPIPPTPEGGGMKQSPSMVPNKEESKPLPEPNYDDIIKYDLDIQDYDIDQDVEDVDFTELP